MGEARRRKPVEVKGDDLVIGSGTAAYLLEKSVDRMFLFGPVVRWPRDEPSARQWRSFSTCGGRFRTCAPISAGHGGPGNDAYLAKWFGRPTG
jgi:hypothetical protein